LGELSMENNIKVYVKGVGYEGVDWKELAEDRIK
jgi:hypothetical protein